VVSACGDGCSAVLCAHLAIGVACEEDSILLQGSLVVMRTDGEDGRDWICLSVLRGARMSEGNELRANCNFSLVMACSAMEKSKGVMEILVTFWKGKMKHFLVMRTFSTPTPVTARYELGSET